MKLIRLAYKSLLSRKVLLSLSLLALGASLSLLLTLQSLRSAAQEGFTQTVSQVDLLVGARGGSLQLLLFSVFNVGSATNNVSIESYQKWKSHPSIQWTIPYSLGDSFQGYRVVGTDENFFQHYRFRGQQKIEFKSGQAFQNLQEVVISEKAAQDFDLKIGSEVTITHGVTKGVGVLDHDDRPFKVVGILNSTGTALDQSVYISLESMELIHLPEGESASLEQLKSQVKSITSFFVRTKNRIETLSLQREINSDPAEPLMAVVPGVALSELWRNLSFFERALELMVGLVSLFGLFIVMLLIYSALENRRRELSLYRSLGAGPVVITKLLLIESLFLGIGGVLIGLILHRLLIFLVSPFLQSEFGMNFSYFTFSTTDVLFSFGLIFTALITSAIPAWMAQKQAVKDGLAPKI
ncbi:MAG: ABC transporter permease [Bdellovibrionales bacterium]